MTDDRLTAYTGYDVELQMPTHELVTATKVSIDVPDYLDVEKGVLLKKWVDFKGSLTMMTETINDFFTPLALVAGCWQDMIAIPFINYSCHPVGKMPYLVTLVNVNIKINIPSADKMEGGPLEQELTILPGNVLVNGVSIRRPKKTSGI